MIYIFEYSKSPKYLRYPLELFFFRHRVQMRFINCLEILTWDLKPVTMHIGLNYGLLLFVNYMMRIRIWFLKKAHIRMTFFRRVESDSPGSKKRSGYKSLYKISLISNNQVYDIIRIVLLIDCWLMSIKPLGRFLPLPDNKKKLRIGSGSCFFSDPHHCCKPIIEV